MKNKISFHYLAEEELNEAAQYYDQKCPGLGTLFLNDLEFALNHILEYPQACPLVTQTVRRKLMARFPCGLMFISDEEGIKILAVMNLYRRPYYWRHRN